MYTIRVNYKTGSSFHTEECETEIGHIWESLDLAKKALGYIKEHYEFYQERDDSYYRKGRPNKVVEKEIKNSIWYKNATHFEPEKSYNESFNLNYSCAAEMDDGTWRNLPTSMWCGYFERLDGAEIVSLSSKDGLSFHL